jgi:hypothetical protein
MSNDPMVTPRADLDLVIDGKRERLRAGISRLLRSLVPANKRHLFVEVPSAPPRQRTEARAHTSGGGPLHGDDDELRAELAAREETIARVTARNDQHRARARRPARSGILHDAVPMLSRMSAGFAGTGPDERDTVERGVRLPARDVEAEEALANYDAAVARQAEQAAHDLDPKVGDAMRWERAQQVRDHEELRSYIEGNGYGATVDEPEPEPGL